MSTIKNGGPAFPIPLLEGQSYQGHAPCDGMTLRDYFAAKALGVMCASNVNATGTFATPEGRETVARACYFMADAMLRAREAK